MPQLQVSEKMLIYAISGAMRSAEIDDSFFKELKQLWPNIYSHNRKFIVGLIVKNLDHINLLSLGKWRGFLEWSKSPLNQIGYDNE